MTAPQLPTGTVFAEQFRVVQPLALGALGARYAVEQLGTGHVRALEVMDPALARDPAARERFGREAQAAARIESEHAAEVIGAGVDSVTGAPWVATELLRGENLAGSVARRGALPPGEVLAVFRQLCHALGAAHAAGVVHGDVRPENVYLEESRRSGDPLTVKVAEFGVARWLQDVARGELQALGPPTWRAPERLDPRGPMAPDGDVWALGLLAYYLLTGSHYWASAGEPAAPWPRLSAEVMYEPIEPASARAAWSGRAAALPPGFDGWFSHCVARDRAARFANAAAAMNALEPVLAHAAPQSRGSYAPQRGSYAPPRGSDAPPRASARPPADAGPFGAIPPTEATNLASVPYGRAPSARPPAPAHSDSIAWSESVEPPPPAPTPTTIAPAAAAAPSAPRASRGRALPLALFALAVVAGAGGIVAWAKLRGTGAAGGIATAPHGAAATHGAVPQQPPGPRTSARGCAGTWTGTLLAFGGAREATVAVTDVQGGLCGRVTERLASGENCEFPLSGCSVSDLLGSTVLVSNGTTGSAACAARHSITLTCVGSSATLVGTVEDRAGAGRAAGGSLQRR